MQNLKVKITNVDGVTTVTDADTGKEIPCRAVYFHHIDGEPSAATLIVYADVVEVVVNQTDAETA